MHAPLVGELADEDIEYVCVRLAGMRREVAEAELTAVGRSPQPATRGRHDVLRYLQRGRGPAHRDLALYALRPTGTGAEPCTRRARGRAGPCTGPGARTGPLECDARGTAVISSDERFVEDATLRGSAPRHRRLCAGGAPSAARGARARTMLPPQRFPRTSAQPPSAAVTTRLRLLLDARQVLGAAEGLGVDLVDVLGARRPGGEPGVLGDDLQPADRRVVARRLGQPWR